MIDSNYRNPYQKYIAEPAARSIAKTGITPTFITLFAALSGIVTIPLIAMGRVLFACAALTLSGFLDTLDGTLARQSGQTSRFGAALDICADRIVEFSVILGLYLYAPVTRGLPCILMLGSVLLCITSFLVVGIFTENSTAKSFHYSPGIMERAEAFSFFLAMILLPQYFLILAYLFTTLLLLTAAIRLVQFARHGD